MLSKSGLLVCLASPSGGGKTTIIWQLLTEHEDYRFSVSCTTRAPRKNERYGVDYYYLSMDEFHERITAGDLVEYETVHEDMYGTLKAPIDSAFENNQVLLLDIDVKGAQNLKKKYGDECVTIFIQPPSIEVLKKRLIDRGTETESSFEKRVDRIEMEMDTGKQFDFQVINDSIEDAISKVENIIENKRSEIMEEVKNGA